MKKILAILLVCVSLISAADSYSRTVDFEDESSGTSIYHFETGLNLEVDRTCSVEGIVLSGDPCDGSAQVCVGTNITVTPSITSRWAVGGNLDVVSRYPYCAYGGYCPAMEDYSSKNERNIEWLTSTLFDDYAVGGGGHEYAGDPIYFDDGIPRYHELGGSGAFDTQSVDYKRTVSEPVQTDKKGYANVFCKGTYELRHGGTVLSRREMASGSPPSTTVRLTSEGTRTLRTSLSDVECFAGLVKHPEDLDHPEWFGLYFYGYETPSISDLNKDSTIQVVDIDPELEVDDLDIVAYSGDIYLLRIAVQNTGDVRVMVTRVMPLCDTSCSAHGVGPWDCVHYGFCGYTSGLGQYIAPGATHYLYIVYRGPFTGDILDLTYTTEDPVCSAETEWELTVTVEEGISSCEIHPSSNIVTPYEVHEYTVSCYNPAGIEVPCAGSSYDWSWDGLSGGFVEEELAYSYAYTSESGDASGRIQYQIGSVTCYADVRSDGNGDEDPYVFTCDLTPDSVTMDQDDSQYFDLMCTESYHGVTNYLSPESVDYDLVNGLDGALSEESVLGVNFTATVANVSGDVEALSWHTHSWDGSLVGYIDWSDVTVGAGGGNETPPDDNETEEDEDCLIVPSDITTYPAWSGDVYIYCGDDFTESCSGVDWSMDSSIGGITEGDDVGASYLINTDAEPGDEGDIRATVYTGTDEEGFCHADVSILAPNCIEIS